MTIHLYQYFQLISLLSAIVYFKGLKQFKLAAFIPLLFFTCTIELLATNFKTLGYKSNYSIYNFYLIAHMPILLHLQLQMLYLNKKERFVFIIIGILAIVFSCVNYMYLQGNGKFNSYSFILFESLTIMVSSLILARYVINDEQTIPLLKSPIFFINAGLLLFGLGCLSVLGLQEYILANKLLINGITIYKLLMPSLNIILYSSYAYAFYLCSHTKNK